MKNKTFPLCSSKSYFLTIPKGSALKNLLQTANWDWQDRLIYFVDDRKSHLEDYEKSFGTEIKMRAFEYTYSHSQYVDEAILNLQLQDFLSGNPIQEDSTYLQPK